MRMKLGPFLAALVVVLAACAPVRERAPQVEEQPPAGLWSPSALAELVAAAEAAPTHGLPAETTALAEIARFQRQGDAVSVAQLDVAADALFAALARSLAQGATDPATADPSWGIPQAAAPDLAALLTRRSAGEAPSALLDELSPRSLEYGLLREELARVSAEPAGALDAQQRTRESRLESLRASLERQRWLPRDMPASRVEARVPQFEVVLFQAGVAAQRHAAIVGARRSPSPTFTAEIRSVTVNPYWEPPASIVINELLPRFRRDPSAAARENYEALDASGHAVALSTVDWRARPFPYRLRQRPGPGNALGQLRFDLPNPHAVYLHDTPSRSLFARENRALSHGCIRVQDPQSLAVTVLGSADWNADALNAEIETGETRTIPLESPMPIYVVYVTATALDGVVAYADDIYGRDQRVVRALDAPEASLVAERPLSPARCPA